MLGGGLARKLAKKAVAAAVAAGAALVAVIAFGATIFYALCLVLVPLAAAALTMLLFALVALMVVMVFLRREAHEEDIEDDEPVGLGDLTGAAVLSRSLWINEFGSLVSCFAGPSYFSYSP